MKTQLRNRWLERRASRNDPEWMVIKYLAKYSAYYFDAIDLGVNLNLGLDLIADCLNDLHKHNLVEGMNCAHGLGVHYRITTTGLDRYDKYKKYLGL